MTTITEKQTKQPAFYIFVQDESGKSIRVGAAFPHHKGKGFNILIANKRYIAFPPRATPETGEGA